MKMQGRYASLAAWKVFKTDGTTPFLKHTFKTIKRYTRN
jgi:hypothetical protein